LYGFTVRSFNSFVKEYKAADRSPPLRFGYERERGEKHNMEYHIRCSSGQKGEETVEHGPNEFLS